MKVSELKKIIKQVIREAISEKHYNKILKEVSPPGAKAERMIHHVKDSLRKSHPDWSEDKIVGVAIATGWKSHDKGEVEEMGLTSEADKSYKVVPKTTAQFQKDNQALQVQIDPKINEKEDKWIQNAVNKSHKGYCTPMTKSTCTPARKALAKRFKKGIDEESYKTQGPGYKTFEDSPQLPSAVNNPENS